MKGENVVGTIAHGSWTHEGKLIVNEGEEENLELENLVLIDNKNIEEHQVLGVIRNIRGINDNLKTGLYSPGIAYARKGRSVSDSKEFFDGELQFIGELNSGNGLEKNRTGIAPGSEVRKIGENENPMSWISSSPELSVSHYYGHPSWKIPLKNSLERHLAIYGSTGCGKSTLVREKIIPLYNKAGYSTIIFDWSGMDYRGKEFKEIEERTGKDISINEIYGENISLNKENICKNIFSLMETERSKTDKKIEEGVRNILSKAEKQKIVDWGFDGFEKVLKEQVSDKYGSHRKIKNYVRKMKRKKSGMKEIIGGERSIASIVKRAKDGKATTNIVINFGNLEGNKKRSIFLNIAERLYKRCKTGESRRGKNLDVGLVIDEAPQYCPYKPRRLQKRTTEIIKNLGAVGRKYNLSLCLISQGVKGEVGINAAIRRNMNSKFIGKLDQRDVISMEKLLNEGYKISQNNISSMNQFQFYITGTLNDYLGIPILMEFKPSWVGENEEV